METTPSDPNSAAPLAPPSPVDDDPMSEADRVLVDDAVSHLNQAITQSGLALAREVSDYIITRFFEGSFENFSEPNRYKSNSFKALCRREDLQLSPSSLYALIRVGEQLDRLPPRVSEALSFKHHRALLPAADDAERVRLASDAVAHGWSAAELADAVRATHAPSGRGRPPLPGVLKEVRAIRRAIVTEDPTAAIADLSDDQRADLLSELSAVEAHLAALRAALGA